MNSIYDSIKKEYSESVKQYGYEDAKKKAVHILKMKHWMAVLFALIFLIICIMLKMRSLAGICGIMIIVLFPIPFTNCYEQYFDSFF